MYYAQRSFPEVTTVDVTGLTNCSITVLATDRTDGVRVQIEGDQVAGSRIRLKTLNRTLVLSNQERRADTGQIPRTHVVTWGKRYKDERPPSQVTIYVTAAPDTSVLH